MTATGILLWELIYGTTTIEAKSGYEMTYEGELKQLEIIHTLNKIHPIDLVATFLAQGIPPQFEANVDELVNEITEKWIPEIVKRKLAEYADVFCEKGYFNLEQTRKILLSARNNGLKLRNHCDWLAHSGGTRLSVEIGDIVRAVYRNDSKKSYMAVKESLIKMDFIEVRVIDEKTLRSTKTEIFYNVTIEEDEISGKEVARIIFSENLIHEFVKNQTVSIYNNKIIDTFQLKSSKVLIYVLQRQRFLYATQKDEPNPIVFHTNLNFFRGALVFGSIRRANQIRIIEETLNEIMKSGITLQSYTRNGDNFTLVFHPFSEEERVGMSKGEHRASHFLSNQP